jgi:hypothetical protein
MSVADSSQETRSEFFRKRSVKVKRLLEAARFVHGLRTRLRFGDLSRSSLRLLRFSLEGEMAECDWLARSPDPWDETLSSDVREGNASNQALMDAIAIRAMLFSLLPQIRGAELRAFRQAAREPPELIIAGTVHRDQRAPSTVRSLAMRARLFGFRFWLDEGVLENLEPEQYAVNS